MKIINLLPKVKQQELRYEELFHSIGVASALAVTIMLLVLVMQLGMTAYLSHIKTTTEKNTERTRKAIDKQENNEIRSKIKLINAQMTDFKGLLDNTPAWSKVLLALAKQVPEGVKINALTADLATKKITINGQSPTREQVIALYNNLSQAHDDFRDIDYPLENVAKPTEVNFHFTFFIQDKLLQNVSQP
jgi:Tfp pilus assembly protein PilN